MLGNSMNRPDLQIEYFVNTDHIYRITHYTPRLKNAGTDEWVYVHLRGPQGDVIKLIDNPDKNDREQGSTDTYIIGGAPIGPIQAIGFRMVRSTDDGNWPWYCRSVQVDDLTSGYSAYIKDFGWVNEFDRIFWRSAFSFVGE